jgi:hypothetical protein
MTAEFVIQIDFLYTGFEECTVCIYITNKSCPSLRDIQAYKTCQIFHG